MRIALAALVTTLAFVSGPLRADGVTSFELDNGMQVVVVENRRAPVVVHMVWYRVGSADEPHGKSGIAHFLEHLMFKATDELVSGELSDTVARNGGSDNAFTSFDYTGYFQRIAADRLDLVMDMEASRMDGLKLVEGDIATERDVVIEERNQRVENNPSALYREQKNAVQYLNHRYGVPIIGWKHEADVLSLEDANAFYEQHYGPNNAILVVAGDVDPDEVKALPEKHYGVIEPNPAIVPRARPSEPPQLADRRLSYADPRIGNNYMTRRYLVPERDPGDQKAAAALNLLARVLGGSSTTSVLAQKLQFENPVALYTSAWYNGQALDSATFGLAFVPVPGVTLEDGEALLDEAVAEFLEEGVDAAQLERIKMSVRSQRVYAQDNVSSIANRYGRGLTVGLTVEDIEAWPKLLEAVTEEDILAAARKFLDRKSAVTGFVRTSDEVTQ